MTSPKAVAFLGNRRAALIEQPVDDSPLKPTDVAGRTLVTLVSPGTELNWGFDAVHAKPQIPGYASVFEVESVGSEVADVLPGQLLFSMGHHASHQRRARRECMVLPAGLSPEHALFARLIGVSWTTLTTTAARPADCVVIFGLGPVGNLAAQLFTGAGYTVTCVEPHPSRREIAGRCGLKDIRAAAPLDDPGLVDVAALAIDCSGHEAAVLDACKIVRKRGEVVLVGVPWKRRSELTAFDLTHAIFHRYINLRTGWEWELPNHPNHMDKASVYGNLASALQWLAEGRFNVTPLYRIAAPAEAQEVYDELFTQRGQHPTIVFDWR